MNWEQAKKLLEMQGITPTDRDRELMEMGFVSHILMPVRDGGWGRETRTMMQPQHVDGNPS
tara:strand:- start:12044 stop:12226 length:183 start_codon:yes stop_codon:yes gene_type:complete